MCGCLLRVPYIIIKPKIHVSFVLRCQYKFSSVRDSAVHLFGSLGTVMLIVVSFEQTLNPFLSIFLAAVNYQLVCVWFFLLYPFSSTRCFEVMMQI